MAGSQLAAADDAPTTDESTSTDDADPVDEEPVDDETVDSEPVDEPVNDESDDDASDDADPSDVEPDGGHVGDWEFPALDELETAFEEFDQCLAEQLPDFEDGGWMDIESGELPDIGDWDKEFEDLLGGSVTVFSPGAEDGDLTLLDFGDGDGTITITKTDGTISVNTDGDIETVDAGLPNLGNMGDFDLPDFEFEPDPEVDAAFESCSSLLPGDGMFDMVGELVGEFVGDFGHGTGAEDE